VIEKELRPKRNGGSFLSVRLSYTTRGQVIEHVTLGLEILERHVGRFPGFPLELKTILQHFIVSHHGDLNKGGLRRPMLLGPWRFRSWI
jgi:23S rRNA maturation-related 3'-5' exoribonuclease YhaM